MLIEQDVVVDMILCDLPQGKKSRNDWDVMIPFELLWSRYNRIIKNNAAILLFGCGMFTADLMHSNPRIWRYNLIWEKVMPTGHLNANKMPLRSHEDICVFYKKLPTFNPQKTHGHKRKVSKAVHRKNCVETLNYHSYTPITYDSTDRYPKSVIRCSHDKQKAPFHSTQKPVKLLEYLIKTYSNEGDLILDNCMGSGSTGVAAKNLKRRFIGIENVKKFFDISCNRIL